MNDAWVGSRVLVTGADGFVGSWLARALLNKGAIVVGLARDGKPYGGLRLQGISDQVVRIQGDLCDASLMNRLLNEYEIDTCMHLAAQAIVPIANRNPASTFESNIRGKWTLLEQCRILGTVKRILVSTSDKVYGCQQDVSLGEEEPLLGEYPYDASKACADLLARVYAKHYGLPITVTRFANIYGGGDLNFSRIVPYTIRCALQGIPIELRGDGASVREYLFIDDAVSAFLAVGEKMIGKELMGQAFNFGSGRAVRVSEIVDLILRIAGNPGLCVQAAKMSAAGEIPIQKLDHRKSMHQLGWEPTVTLEEGIRRTVDWYRENERLLSYA